MGFDPQYSSTSMGQGNVVGGVCEGYSAFSQDNFTHTLFISLEHDISQEFH